MKQLLIAASIIFQLGTPAIRSSTGINNVVDISTGKTQLELKRSSAVCYCVLAGDIKQDVVFDWVCKTEVVKSHVIVETCKIKNKVCHIWKDLDFVITCALPIK